MATVRAIAIDHAAHNQGALDTLHAGMLIAIVCVAVLYAVGIGRLRRQRIVNTRQTWYGCVFMATGLALMAAFCATQFDVLAHQLVSFHMAQHLVLMLVVAPLFVLAHPLNTLRSSITNLPLKRVAPAPFSALIPCLWLLHRPETAWCLFCGTIILWHLPAPYRSAHAHLAYHALMQASFLVAGLLFWSVILERGRRRLAFGPTILYVLSAALVTSMPGALLSFAHRPILENGNAQLPFGFSWLEDQQLAGLLMWIPMDLVFFAVTVFLFSMWLRTSRGSQSDLRAVDPNNRA